MKKLNTVPIVDCVEKTVIETFDAMMDMKMTRKTTGSDPNPDPNRLVGIVNFSGEASGVLSIQVTKSFSEKITAAMLGIESEAVEDEKEDEFKDVIGEICNIISGNLKSDFVEADLYSVISPPSITSGREFKIEETAGEVKQRLVFRHGGDELIIEWAFKEDAGGRKDTEKIASLSPEEVRNRIESVDVNTAIVNSVIDVFDTMLSMDVERLQQIPDDYSNQIRASGRTVGSVSFAGDVEGIFNLELSRDLSKNMARAMLMLEEEELEDEEEIHDVVREVTNIIGGNLKSTFSDIGLSCVLSTPSITHGTDFRVDPINTIAANRFIFKHRDFVFVIVVGVKKEARETDEQPAAESSPKTILEQTTTSHEAVPRRKSPQTGPVSKQSPGDGASGKSYPKENLGFVLDIPMAVTVVLGRTRQSIEKVLKIQNGSVVSFSQLSGEPVELLVRNTLIARGEVILQNEKYGIRITEIVNRKERLDGLR